MIVTHAENGNEDLETAKFDFGESEEMWVGLGLLLRLLDVVDVEVVATLLCFVLLVLLLDLMTHDTALFVSLDVGRFVVVGVGAGTRKGVSTAGRERVGTTTTMGERLIMQTQILLVAYHYATDDRLHVTPSIREHK
ncbi:unnamed protein product [Zymoseptoria tritici ST99CH_3D7]|uniref:Uncharacterized protein n=2 Tax=Zymoseptoria tritici TaxID=1047171 RepID=A0A1X7RHE5_ZYMT9|nr:unnamed protein product [Zymoseptoria tritici ST99CH_3D7]